MTASPLSSRIQWASDDPAYLAALDEYEAACQSGDEEAQAMTWRGVLAAAEESRRK